MARFFVEELRLFLPFLPDELCWCEAVEGLEPSGVGIGVDKQIKVSAQLVVVLTEGAFDVQRENDPPGAVEGVVASLSDASMVWPICLN